MISTDEIKKILEKNSKSLVQELKQSKELVILLNKSAYTKLSEEEKSKVKSQLLDVLKSIPALAVFLLPGGLVLLPIIAKLIPDILPSTFRDHPDKDE